MRITFIAAEINWRYKRVAPCVSAGKHPTTPLAFVCECKHGQSLMLVLQFRKARKSSLFPVLTDALCSGVSPCGMILPP